MTEQTKKLVTEMDNKETIVWANEYGGSLAEGHLYDKVDRIEFTPEQLRNAIEAAMEEAEDAIVYPKNYSPSIMDCDGTPQAMKEVILTKGSMESLANLYLLIDTWGGKQRKYVEDSLRPPEDIDCPVCEKGKLIANHNHWCDKCGVTVGTTEDASINVAIMHAHVCAEVPKDTPLMDLQAVHNAVLKLKMDPKENERVRFGFNCGVHSAAATISQFHNFKK
jgi:hypothetical protein